jgi:hypothetical protein
MPRAKICQFALLGLLLTGCRSSTSAPLGESGVLKEIARLPEVQEQAKRLAAEPGWHLLLMIDGEREAPESRWVVYVGESCDTHANRLLTFEVDPLTHAIWYFDVAGSVAIPLETWRRERR